MEMWQCSTWTSLVHGAVKGNSTIQGKRWQFWCEGFQKRAPELQTLTFTVEELVSCLMLQRILTWEAISLNSEPTCSEDWAAAHLRSLSPGTERHSGGYYLHAELKASPTALGEAHFCTATHLPILSPTYLHEFKLAISALKNGRAHLVRDSEQRRSCTGGGGPACGLCA